MRWLVFGLVLLISCTALVHARGYTARAVGFDLNNDGVRGEVGVDDLVCDDTSGTGILAEDIDGDSTSEEQIYVDCDAGTDNGACGGPANPCLTIDYAINTRADGPGDGAEDQVCFKGTCTPDKVRFGLAGVTGTYTVAATGSQVRSWEYPSDPFRLVGWDADNDGSYPPFDTDDTAVLDGDGLDYAFLNNVGYLELAHFSVIDYGQTGTFSGFMLNDPNSAYHYYHDLDMDRIMQDQATLSGVIVWDGWGMPASAHWAFENIKLTNTGSFAWRGGSAGSPIRIQNLTYSAHGSNGDTAHVFKMWGADLTGVEMLDSIMDYNVAAWTPQTNGGSGFVFPQCARDLDFINNEMIDYMNPVYIQSYATGYCDTRSMTDINIERNLIRDSNWPNNFFIQLIGDTGASNPLEDVTILNNILVDSGDALACFSHGAESASSGTLIYSFNTCQARVSIAGLQWTGAARQDNVEMKNNIFATTGNPVMKIQDAPSNWDADHNIYLPGSSFVWNGGSATDLAAWRAASGGDVNSAQCAPSFVSATDLHLQSSDSCAQDAGIAVAGLAVDIDGDFRPQGPGWDIGADEVTAGGCHWADNDCNADISISELVSVVLDWQAGSRTISELVEVVLLWQA